MSFSRQPELAEVLRLLRFKVSLKSVLTLMLKHERAQASEREKAMARDEPDTHVKIKKADGSSAINTLMQAGSALMLDDSRRVTPERKPLCVKRSKA
jgi:hypothetical protein